jgi:hypothetical protein
MPKQNHIKNLSEEIYTNIKILLGIQNLLPQKETKIIINYKSKQEKFTFAISNNRIFSIIIKLKLI